EAGGKSDVRMVLDRHLAAIERVHGSGGVEHMQTISMAIPELAQAGFTDDARRLLHRLESNALLHAGTQSPEMAEVLELRAQVLSAEGKNDDALKGYREWLRLRGTPPGRPNGTGGGAPPPNSLPSK